MVLDAETVCGFVDNNLAGLIHTVIVILKFGIPILLIIFGMLDFAKGVIASKEDEIKNGQRMFIKRIISAVLVFFVVTIVQLLVGVVDDEGSGVWECANLIMNGDVQSNNTNTSKEDENKDLEKEKRVNEAIKQCCIESEGEFIEGNSNGKKIVSCMTDNDEQTGAYNQCYTENVKPIQSGIK